jgi:4-diphosphocytidyl-2-C-methyl-D-erythritol kinase
MAPTPLVVRAPAKLNLFLTITGRRADGYHTLDSLFAFCGLHDEIAVTAADDLVLRIAAGRFAPAISGDADNLVLRAARLLQRESGVTAGAGIDLAKEIPVAAGLGGGSADAAATLLALNTYWDLHWPPERLETIAASLGADVPACIRSRPVYARGTGERLEPAPELPEAGILLVNPLVATPTPAVFKAFATQHPLIPPRDVRPPPGAYPSLDALVAIMRARGNDLTGAAVEVTPAIAAVLARLRSLPGVAFAGLSGSGATCFALFASREAAAAAGDALGRMQPGWWRWSGGFHA